MLGFITERDFEEAETEFPGIVQLFRSLEQKPKTFLDLYERYIHCDHPSPTGSAGTRGLAYA
jgi:hypothetical protein